MLGEPVEERRKERCDKSTSSKHFRPQHHNLSNSQTQEMRSPFKTSQMIQALSPTGSNAASYAQLGINPHLFTPFSGSTGHHYHTSAGGMIRYGRSSALERNREHGGTGSQEKPHQLGQEVVEKDDTTGSYREPGQRINKSQVTPQLGSEEAEETEGLCDIERVIIGRKASKKHKSK